jgi:ribosome recycling factor
VFPQLTEQRRRELGKTARSKGEDAKVSIRNIRRKCTQVLDKLVKDGEVGEDDVTRAEKELQQITDRYTSQVDEMVKHKEAELLEV